MHALIVEKNIRTKGRQERTLVTPTQEQRLVDTYTPVSQGQNHALVRRCGACRDQRRANRIGINGIGSLQFVQGLQQTLERTTAQRFPRSRPLPGSKGRQALLLKYPLRLVTKQHRITVVRRTSSSWVDKNRSAPSASI